MTDISFLIFCGLLKKCSLDTIPKTLIFEKLNDLEIVLRDLSQNAYQFNCNKSIYALKDSGKPFFINKSGYDLNIYFHQTNVENPIFSCNGDLMYILSSLFSENIPKLNRQELESVLKVLPNECYFVNCNETIFSLKVNGKPFFIDENFYNLDLNSCEMAIDFDPNHNLYQLSFDSKTLGKKLSQENRLVFMSFKDYEKGLKKRLYEELRRTGHKRVGKKWVSQMPLNPEIYLNRKRLISQNGKYEDPMEVSKVKDKWDKALVRRKIYQKSELMLTLFSIKEVKHILNKCKESLYEKKERDQRRKDVRIDAIMRPVVDCDLLDQTLYSICESEDSNLLE